MSVTCAACGAPTAKYTRVCYVCGIDQETGQKPIVVPTVAPPLTKRCAFCAEEVQHAAIVCKHCGRNLPVPTPFIVPDSPRRQAWQVFKAVTGIILAVCVMGYCVAAYDPPDSEPPNLRVSAARGVSGVTLTNREDGHIYDCILVVLDEGDDQWSAEIKTGLAEQQSVVVQWSQFKARGQTMPAHIGMNRKTFTLSCFLSSNGQQRLVGFLF